MLLTLLQASTDVVAQELEVAAQELNFSLWDMAVKGGWLMLILLALSIVAIYIFGQKWWTIRRAAKIDKNFMNEIRNLIHEGKIAETYNIGGFNEWKNIDLIKVMIKTVDRLLGNPEGSSLELITYVTDRAGHDLRYAIDSTKLQKELGWEPSLQFEEGIEKTVRWYLDNQEWMDNITSGEYEKYYESMYAGR